MDDTALAGLRAWLADEGLQFESTQDGLALDVRIPESGGRTMRIALLPHVRHLVFSMAATRRAKRKGWSALYPLLSDANASVSLGAWVLDPLREALVFRVGLPAVGAVYDVDALKAVMSYVASTVGAWEASFRGAAEDGVLAAWAAETE
jgi:hypothetical protein